MRCLIIHYPFGKLVSNGNQKLSVRLASLRFRVLSMIDCMDVPHDNVQIAVVNEGAM